MRSHRKLTPENHRINEQGEPEFRCRVCDTFKLDNAFDQDNWQCTICFKAYMKTWRDANRDKRNAYLRSWRKADRQQRTQLLQGAPVVLFSMTSFKE